MAGSGPGLGEILRVLGEEPSGINGVLVVSVVGFESGEGEEEEGDEDEESAD